MPLACRFELNGQPMSMLKCGAIGDFPAFSGSGEHRNAANSTGIASTGPLPKGRYYILARESGGRLGWLRDIFGGSDKDEWFALYRDDGSIDDTTFVGNVRRGAFRLHPRGPLGISEGCVTLENGDDFNRLRRALLASQGRFNAGNRMIDYYGTIEVE